MNVLKWAHLLREAGLDESEEFINVGRFKGNARSDVFHHLIPHSCWHKSGDWHFSQKHEQRRRTSRGGPPYLAASPSMARACC